MAFAKQNILDLDKDLSSVQKSELLAYSVLLQTRLEVATVFSTWCEAVGYSEIQKVLGQLPFPLNHVIPWSQKREVMRKYGNLNADEVCQESFQHLKVNVP